MFNCLCINDLLALQRYKNFWTFLLFPLCFKALSTIYLQVGNFSQKSCCCGEDKSEQKSCCCGDSEHEQGACCCGEKDAEQGACCCGEKDSKKNGGCCCC